MKRITFITKIIIDGKEANIARVETLEYDGSWFSTFLVTDYDLKEYSFYGYPTIDDIRKQRNS